MVERLKLFIMLVECRWRLELWLLCRVWKLDSIALGQVKNQLGCQTALEMDVMLAFWEISKEVV